jgi:hypothetical protein
MRTGFALVVPVCSVIATTLPTLSAAADDRAPAAITIDVRANKLTPEAFRLIASRALLQRNWRILESEPTRVVGTLTKHSRLEERDIEYRSEIVFADEQITIRYVPGYAPEKINWLRNLEKDILIELQLHALPK